MKSITNRLAALLCSAAVLTGMCSTTTIWAEETNLITNSDFENGIDGWSMYHHSDADAEIFAQDGTLAMTVRSLGALNYAVQLSGNAVDLVENACYQLEFDISSTQDRYIDAIVQQQGGSYQAYAAQGLNLTADMQHIELVFRMEYASSAATLVFNCGNHNETLSEHTIYLDNVSLIQVDDSALEQYDPYEPPIVVNQVGYTPNAQKIAVFRHITNETQFSVLNADSGEIVYTSELYGEYENTAADETNWYGDFSDITAPGTYYITCGNLDHSYPFTISSNVYDNLLDEAVRMLYLQRCGCEVVDETYGHSACHTSHATILGTEDTIDVTGGWHDAGDYGRYVVPAAKAVADLLLAYEANPAIHSDNIGIPESGNGIPDILDEARYEIAWMLKMQAPSGGVYHKVNCPGMAGSVMPEKETGMQYVTPVSTTATADFCAVMAMAAEYYAPIDQAFAESCLTAAKAAWAFLQENPDLILVDPSDLGDDNGGYEDTRDGDERYWAACQLYRVTGDAAYLNAIDSITGTYYKDGLEWHMVGHYGNIALLTMENADKSSKHYATAQEMLNNWVNEYTTTSSAMGYQTAIDKFVWGSNMSVANSGIVLAIADRLAADDAHMNTVQLQLDYLLGRNPNGICYVTGFGTVSPINPHHRPSIVKGQPMPGMLVGGVNADLADETAQKYLSDTPSAKRYIDHSGSYSTNEITIYWNAPLIYLLSLTMEPTDPVRGDVNADGSFTMADIVMMAKFLSVQGSLTDWAAGDLNADQEITAADLSLMKQQMLS